MTDDEKNVENKRRFWDDWITIAVKKTTRDKLREIMFVRGFYNYNEAIEYLLEEVENDNAGNFK